MNVIESLLADAERHEADLTRRVEELQGELKDTKHMLREVARHRERLTRDCSRGAAMLPLGEPAAQEPDLDVIQRELDEAEDADDDAFRDAERDGPPSPDKTDAPEEFVAAESAPEPESEPARPKRGRKKAEAAGA